MSYIEERNKYWTIYPEHLDYRMSRRLGRKISLDYSIYNPTLDEITMACEVLKIPYIVEKDKHHPSNWIERKGRLKIPKLKRITKRQLLKLIAHKVRLIREKKIKIDRKPERRVHIERVLKRIKKKR